MEQKQYAGQLLTILEVAEILRVNAATVRRWVNSGVIKSIILPSPPGAQRRLIRVKGEVVDAILSDEEK